MKRDRDPLRILNGLLDRLERQPDRSRRVTARPSLAFASPDERRRLTDILLAARDTGAVELTWDRDAPHLVSQVALSDPTSLYRFLARTPVLVHVENAITALSSLRLQTDVARALRNDLIATWRLGKSALGIAPTQTPTAAELLRAADAAFAPLEEGSVPLRTRSARLLGDSKALERWLPKLLSFLRRQGRIDTSLSNAEALEMLGLSKFPQPLLIAGPLIYGATDLARWTYAGLPPEAVTGVTVRAAVTTLLTIENLESFNRHVRECRGSSDIVVYTGGFPSPHILSLIRRLVDESGLPAIHHWGDIDPGGLKIGHYLEMSLAVPVVPHLMTVGLARRLGRPSGAPSSLPLGDDSAFAALAEYLRSSDAFWLEQEVVDPRQVGTTERPNHDDVAVAQS